MPVEAILFDPVTRNSTRVTVRVFGSSLEVIGGGLALLVDPAKCKVSAGGWDRGSIEISWSTGGLMWALSLKDPRANGELARIPQFQATLAAAAQAQTRARRSGRFGMALVAILTLLPVLVLLGLLAFSDRIIDAVLERIPITVDQEIGKMFESEVLGSREAGPENEATRAVASIVDKLKTANPDKRFEFKVSVQRNQEVNAFAAPGGLIVIYTGLINEAGSAEEVAGVLAHEMAHATRRHSMRQVLYQGGLLPLMGMLVGQPDAAALFLNLGQLSQLKFSRTQEEEADLVGFDNLVAGGIPTEGMARFFDRLAKMEGAPPPFLSTHPSSSNRAAAIRERTKALKATSGQPLSIDWGVVKASIR